MRKLASEKRVSILAALVEGCSIASTCRITGTSKMTALRLLADVGTLCADLHDQLVQNVRPKRIELDELWAFTWSKDRNVPREREGDPTIGSTWTWVCIDPDSKLVVGYRVGKRSDEDAIEFFRDLSARIVSTPQISTDAHRPYPNLVRKAFGADANYGTVFKDFGRPIPERVEARYSPPTIKRIKRVAMTGTPDPTMISTSMVERQHRTLRMGQRRYTRLTDAFSKRLANHAHATAMHYWHYNFARRHMTLKTTPAVAAGVTDRVWTLGDLAELLERAERQAGSRLTEYLPSAK